MEINSRKNEVVYKDFIQSLKSRGIRVEETNGIDFPANASMHDRAAVVPSVVVSPRSEWGVVQTLTLISELELTNYYPISVKSGGHGYFNGATCTGIMINMADMNQCRIAEDVMYLEPGCILGKTINSLAKSNKAVPHGDCFGVGAGGHFLTAGWDLILGRKYGLGCQSVIGGRVVLWDGRVIDINEDNYPDLLYAMRGGGVAGVGVVTEIRLQLIDEPPLATWRFTPISPEELKICIDNKFFSRSTVLPKDISVSVRMHFEPNQSLPICSFNVVSLLSANKTVKILREILGDEVTNIIADLSPWSEKTLPDIRMLPASDFLKHNPGMLGEVTAEALHAEPSLYWTPSSTVREMASSYFTSISSWVVPNCEQMIFDLYSAFESAQTHPLRERMYTLIILGGGRITELQDRCSMPLGTALARFELHWDLPEAHEKWGRSFTEKIQSILNSAQDPKPNRPYRGDIWLSEQAEDPHLDAIRCKYSHH